MSSSQFCLRLGETIPDFNCDTTQGTFRLHEYIQKDVQAKPWTIIMSHPGDFTPVCTTELGKAQKLFEEFDKRGVKLIAVSCDSIESHNNWSKDILHREGCAQDKSLKFPIISDPSREICTKLGIFDPKTAGKGSLPSPARVLIVIDHEFKVRLVTLYPGAVGKNFDEVLRIIDALKLTEEKGVATPANWKPGDQAVLPTSLSEQEAKSKFGNVKVDNLPSGKQYMRFAGV